jgi:hypothetical protein
MQFQRVGLSLRAGGIAVLLAVLLDVGGCGSSGSATGQSPPDGGPGDEGGPPSPFVHPGVLTTRAQLDFVKNNLGSDPWKTAFAAAQASPLTAPAYAPATPKSVILCGSQSSGPDGALCKAEQSDSQAAYANAILWVLSGDATYAERAIQIMNAWSAVFTSHGALRDPAASNQYVQSGWTGSNWAPAAEIIRYTYDQNGGWAQSDVDRFASMLKSAYLPYVVTDDVRKPFVGDSSPGALVPNGNWESLMIAAGMGIAVFLDDMDSFQKVLAMWRTRVPAYMYLSKDGMMPTAPPLAAGVAAYTQDQIAKYWGGPRTPQSFPLPSPDADGMGQETCRDVTDMHHQEFGYSALVAAAETAHIQGVDLYGEEKDRIVAAFEFAAKYMNGAPVPAWLCPGSGLTVSAHGYNYEIGYNHYANRLGIPMPNTQALLAKIRPTGADHNMVFETLTHGDVH